MMYWFQTMRSIETSTSTHMKGTDVAGRHWQWSSINRTGLAVKVSCNGSAWGMHPVQYNVLFTVLTCHTCAMCNIKYIFFKSQVMYVQHCANYLLLYRIPAMLLPKVFIRCNILYSFIILTMCNIKYSIFRSWVTHMQHYQHWVNHLILYNTHNFFVFTDMESYLRGFVERVKTVLTQHSFRRRCWSSCIKSTMPMTSSRQMKPLCTSDICPVKPTVGSQKRPTG